MIKDVFGERLRQRDKMRVMAFGQRGLGLVRCSSDNPVNPDERKTVFGIFQSDELGTIKGEDGITLTYDELVELAEILPKLIESGEICEIMTEAEFEAAARQRKAAEALKQRGRRGGPWAAI